MFKYVEEYFENFQRCHDLVNNYAKFFKNNLKEVYERPDNDLPDAF